MKRTLDDDRANDQTPKCPRAHQDDGFWFSLVPELRQSIRALLPLKCTRMALAFTCQEEFAARRPDDTGYFIACFEEGHSPLVFNEWDTITQRHGVVTLSALWHWVARSGEINYSITTCLLAYLVVHPIASSGNPHARLAPGLYSCPQCAFTVSFAQYPALKPTFACTVDGCHLAPMITCQCCSRKGCLREAYWRTIKCGECHRTAYDCGYRYDGHPILKYYECKMCCRVPLCPDCPSICRACCEKATTVYRDRDPSS